MAVLENMIDILSKLKIYNLCAGSYIRHELESYIEGFKYVEDKLNEIRREMFIDTALKTGLDIWENILFGEINDTIDVLDRRKIIRSALYIDDSCFTNELMTKALGAVGIDADIDEVVDEERLIVNAKEYRGKHSSYEIIKKHVETILPAHLEITLDMGVFSWSIFESKDFTFEHWDNFEYSWEDLEESGHLL